VSKVLVSANPGERQASALLFSCLVEYQDQDYIRHCFRNGFSHLYQLIDDPDEIVKKNTLNGIVTLAEFFPDVFLNNPNIFHIFDHLLTLASSAVESVQLQTLNILMYITDYLKDDSSNQVSKDPDNILKILINSFLNNLNQNTNK
jgi:hypothetical protein